MSKLSFLKAFTLAEILITLLIIGVVASLVIPAVINDTNEAEYNVGVKKAQAELSNALRMIQANNGGSVNAGLGNTTANSISLRSDFCSVITCVKTDTVASIFGPTIYKYYSGIYTNPRWPSISNSTPSAILNNGTFIQFTSYADCSKYGIACAGLRIDINGKKGPNWAGKDVYSFFITRKNENGYYYIVPAGTQGDTTKTCDTNSASWDTSDGCTAKRLLDPEHMP